MTETDEASRQIRAALQLKRRYELLRGKPVSISALRKDAALLLSFRREIVELGDPELSSLVAAAFDGVFSDTRPLPNTVIRTDLARPSQPPLPPQSSPSPSASQPSQPPSSFESSQPAQNSQPVRVAAAPSPRPRSPAAPGRPRTVAEVTRAQRLTLPVIAAAVVVLLAVVLVAWQLQRGNSAPATGERAASAPPASAPAPRMLLRLHGSNTIGERLAPMLIQGYLAAEGGTDARVIDGADPVERSVVANLPKEATPVAVQLHAHGSATAFTALEAGNADIGMASRPVNATELERLGPKLGNLSAPGAEHVIGLDGIAVIVNRANPVTALTVEQVARVFSGEIDTWDKLGGAARPIQVIARDEKSGTWDTFKALALDRYKLKLGNAVRMESSSDLSDAVAKNPDAIGFIGLPYVRNARALAIADVRGSQALLPTAFTVATEDYPLSRRLFFYTPAQGAAEQAKLAADRFVEFVLSPKGQELVQEAGFVPQRAAPERVSAPADSPESYSRIASRGQRLSLTFRFRPGSDELDNKALRDLDRVLSYLQHEPSARVVLMGFADATGTPAANLQLSRDRAQRVETALSSRGVAIAELIALGAAMPVASNDTPLGRQRNRRVEIWVTL